MKHDYTNLDLYYEELLGDVYPQPMDDGHSKSSNEIINKWINPLGISTVLDVGCGEGEAQDSFVSNYTGIALGRDAIKANLNRRNVYGYDFNFIPFPESSYDLIFSRHSLEHSPFPLLTLMEWHRVSNKWLCLVLPNPEHYKFVGRNHYSVMNAPQAAWILRRAGWKIKLVHIDNEEIWFLCEKAPRLGHEGWAEVPLHNKIYEFERDLHHVKGEINVTKYFKDRGWHGLF